MFVEEEGCGETSAVVEDTSTSGLPNRLVALTTLDHDFSIEDGPIDFLKIDAEGYDLKVLIGAIGLLASGRVWFIQFEYNSFWIDTGSTLSTALRLLRSHGFSVRRLSRDGLVPVEYEYWGEYFRYSNYFAYRETDQDFGKILGGRQRAR